MAKQQRKYTQEDYEKAAVGYQARLGEVREVRVLEFTEKTAVIISQDGRTERCTNDGWQPVFATPREAHNHLIAKARAKVEDAKCELNYAEATLAAVIESAIQE